MLRRYGFFRSDPFVFKSGHTLSKALSFLAVGFFTFGVMPHGTAQTLVPELDPVGPVTILAGGAATNPALGAQCGAAATPVSTDAFGDGCLATQVSLPSTRYVVQDKNGNFFFSDYTNNLIRRIDATTGVITAVAGGAATSPAPGTCTGGTSTDIFGDGCLSTAVALLKPLGLAFASNGDLYFVDGGHDVIRKIAATSGLIPTTGGVVTNVAGHAPATGSASFGYVVSNSTTSIIAATASYIDGPYGIAFDKNGVLYAADEFKNAVYAINQTSSNQTVYGVTLKPGEIWKVVGTTTAGAGGAAGATPVDCTNGTSGTYGCNFGTYTEGGAAGANELDSPYAVAFDPTGNLYIANEFEPNIPTVSTAGAISTYAGAQTSGTNNNITGRAAAAGFNFGSSFAVATDKQGVLYFTDAYNGVVWRVDPDTKTMYTVAGTTQTGCTGQADAFGDGCTSSQAIFGKSVTSGKTYAVAANPGIFGITTDALGNLYVGDSINGMIRKIGTGTNFGTSSTTKIFVHYFKGDSPKTNGYTATSTGNIISVSNTPNCVPNADTSYDCEVDLTSTATTAGPYTGTLTINSTGGSTVTVPLSGVYVPSPVTSLAVTFSASTACSGSYSSTAPITLTATLTSSGGSPTGKVQFFDNLATLGAPATLTGGIATLTQALPAGSHSITAMYSGDGSFNAVGTTSATSITTANPSFGVAVNSTQTVSVKAGGTSLYSFVASSAGYTGTVSFFCSGLPAGASCTFTPQTITASGCSSSTTVAMSIFTTQNTPIAAGSLAGSGRGPWTMITLFAGLGLALGIGFRRRQLGTRFGSIGMALALLLISSGLVACSSSTTPRGGTPPGTYTVTVTAVGSSAASAPTGGSQSFTVPLTVN
jgi:hypothetical protein